MRWFIFPSTLSISCEVILFEAIVFSGNPLILAVYHCSVRTLLDVLTAFESVFYQLECYIGNLSLVVENVYANLYAVTESYRLFPIDWNEVVYTNGDARKVFLCGV